MLLIVQMGRWNEASSTFDKLWGKEQVESAMDELRNANSAQEEEASWAELLTQRYLKGTLKTTFPRYTGVLN